MANSDMEFECSFCGHKWNTTSYKKYDEKIGEKVWTRFVATCPNCSRETTSYLSKRNGDTKDAIDN